MKRFYFLFVLVFSLSSAYAQTYDEKLAFVKARYTAIEGNIETFTEEQVIDKPYEDLAPVAFYTFWTDSAGQVVKAEKSTGEEGYINIERYYYHDNKLIFYYSFNQEPEYSDGGTFYLIDEGRIYFYNEIIFEYLYKMKEPFDQREITQIKNEKGQWDIDMQTDLLNASADILGRLLKKQ